MRVRVTPRARANEIAGKRDGVLLVRVTAAPEGGKANVAVCRLIARALRIAPSRVTVARGGGSKDKWIEVEGVSADQLAGLLSGYPADICHTRA